MGTVRDVLARNLKTVAAVCVLVLVVVPVYFLAIKKEMKKGTAYFTSATNIYPGDPVEIIGVKVGKIDKITPGPKSVKVEFEYEAKFKVPADAKAAIISPSLIPARYVQLAPVYTGGPVLEDGGVIPIERTAVPVEFDELKKQLSEVTKTFGPEGANEDGSLNRILNLAPKFRETFAKSGFDSPGKSFNQFVSELSKAIETLGDGSGDMFATVRNLQAFSSVLVKFEEGITEFGTRLNEVSSLLDEDKDEFAALLKTVDEETEGITQWLRDVRTVAKPFVNEANEVVASLARQRDAIAEVLHAGPTVLQNFSHILNSKTGAVLGKPSIALLGQTGGAFDPLCASIVSATVSPQGEVPDVQEQEMKDAQSLCVRYLGPIFRLTQALPYPLGAPLGTDIIQSPGGGAATRPDPHLSDNRADGNDGQAGAAFNPDSDVPPPLPSNGLADLLGIGGN